MSIYFYLLSFEKSFKCTSPKRAPLFIAKHFKSKRLRHFIHRKIFCCRQPAYRTAATKSQWNDLDSICRKGAAQPNGIPSFECFYCPLHLLCCTLFHWETLAFSQVHSTRRTGISRSQTLCTLYLRRSPIKIVLIHIPSSSYFGAYCLGAHHQVSYIMSLLSCLFFFRLYENRLNI